MKFFKYTNLTDKLMLVFATIMAVCAGALGPTMAIFIGTITNTFNPNSSMDSALNSMRRLALIIMGIGIALWLCGYIYFAFCKHLAERITYTLRKLYLHSLLLQEVAYFEKIGVETIPSTVGDNFSLISDAIGEKL
jgi:ATP-binding cassette subfamily B (MDR/TAP) protein 1